MKEIYSHKNIHFITHKPPQYKKITTNTCVCHFFSVPLQPFLGYAVQKCRAYITRSN